jgi:hypothetical protein
MIRELTREQYDTRHGGPFDRGSADSHYSRPRQPHLYTADTGTSERIDQSQMTPAEIQAYLAGYQWNEQFGDKKSWD